MSVYSLREWRAAVVGAVSAQSELHQKHPAFESACVIATLKPGRQITSVTLLARYARGTGVGRNRGEGAGLGVTLGRGFAVAVGVVVGVAVGVS